MRSNRRNLVLRVSIVINVAVLLYAAVHLSNSNGPPVEWVVETLDGQSAGDSYILENEMRNLTDSSGKSDESTSQKVTPVANATFSVEIEKKLEAEVPSKQPMSSTTTVQSDQNDEYVLSNGTLSKLQNLLSCTQRQYQPQTRQRGEFWALINYVMADHGALPCHTTITYTTHAGFEFLDNVLPLVERWMAPVSVAIHAPGSDIWPTVNGIRYLRDCLESSLVKQYVTFHVFFPNSHIPSKIPQPSIFLAKPYNCSSPPPYKTFNVSNTYMKQKKLLYPINVARNLAREAALTHFILPSDIELYPSPNLVPRFLNMIARNNPPLNSTNPRVFPLSIFEVDIKYQVPNSKSELQALLKKKAAIPFHKFVCPDCHNIPQRDQWINSPETDQMNVFHVGKRQGKFLHWEPIFIGTHVDPYYEERLSWEGKQDKMTQGYVLCVKNYDFMILNNAFLTHKPGIKHYKKDSERLKIAARQTKFIKQVVLPELRKLYGERRGCVL